MRLVELTREPACDTVSATKRFHLSWTKGHLFGLVEFDEIFYLDAATIVTESIDFLFTRLGDSRSVAMVSFADDALCPSKDLVINVPKSRPFDTGVFGLKPSKTLYNTFMNFSANETGCPANAADRDIIKVFVTLKC